MGLWGYSVEAFDYDGMMDEGVGKKEQVERIVICMTGLKQ